MANKNIFIAENMASTKVGSYLRSGQQATVIENGLLVTLDGLAGGLDLYKTKAPATKGDVVYLVDGVEVQADEQLTKGLHDFENPANKPFRLRKPVVGDRFSVSASAITALSGEVVVGNIVENAAAAKLKEAVTATAGTSLVCEVVAKWNFGTLAVPMVRLEVKSTL